MLAKPDHPGVAELAGFIPVALGSEPSAGSDGGENFFFLLGGSHLRSSLVDENADAGALDGSWNSLSHAYTFGLKSARQRFIRRSQLSNVRGR